MMNRFDRVDKISPSSNPGPFKLQQHYRQMSHGCLSNIAHLKQAVALRGSWHAIAFS